MSRLVTTVLPIAILVLLVSPSWAQEETCQYAHVLDRCGKRLVILPTGETDGAHGVALDEGPAADYEPGGVALATAPDWNRFHAFVTQGPFLHVIDYEWYFEEEERDILPLRTLDLVEDLGWTPIHFTGVAAGPALVVNGETYYPLYVVGYVPGPITHPYVMIFDQEVLIDGPLTPNKVLLGAAYLDHLDDSGGVAIDVAAGASTEGGHKQVAYASVLSGTGIDLVQQFHTITIEDGVGFGTHYEPWNEEGVSFSGIEPDAIGVDYESLGLDAYGVFQTSSVVTDLEDGSASCEMGPGDLTDVATWGPDAGLANQYMQFAIASNGDGNVGILLGYPQGVCPYMDPPLINPGSLVQPIGSRPLAMALSSRTGNPFWLYTANASGGVTALELFTFHHPLDGDSVGLVTQFDLALEGCPSAIAFRDETLEACMEQYQGGPGPDHEDDDCPTTKYCKLFPNDPLCTVSLCDKN